MRLDTASPLFLLLVLPGPSHARPPTTDRRSCLAFTRAVRCLLSPNATRWSSENSKTAANGRRTLDRHAPDGARDDHPPVIARRQMPTKQSIPIALDRHAPAGARDDHPPVIARRQMPTKQSSGYAMDRHAPAGARDDKVGAFASRRRSNPTVAPSPQAVIASRRRSNPVT